MMYWLWRDCECFCGSSSGSFSLWIFLKSVCPLDGSQCSRVIGTWKSCYPERRLIIHIYLCKKALVFAISLMICKRVINCTLINIFVLFQSIVFKFHVKDIYTRDVKCSGWKICMCYCYLLAPKWFEMQGICMINVPWSYDCLNFYDLSKWCVFVFEFDLDAEIVSRLPPLEYSSISMDSSQMLMYISLFVAK